ncbi:MAG: hypothetical protein ACJ76V_03960 [Thermoleophilaceae bacterium]
MSTLRQLRKLVLGETWSLPLGVLLALGIAALLHEVAGSWWKETGGFILLGLAALALSISLGGVLIAHTSQERRARRR